MKPNPNSQNSHEATVPKRRVLGSKPAVTPSQSTLPASSSKQFLAPHDSTNELSLSDSSSASLSSSDQLSPAILQENMHLFCPICNEDMASLSQLNRHLDDSHSSSSDAPVRQLDEDIKTWFKKKVINKAADVMNDRKNLVKLDLFDNDRNFTFSTANDSNPTLSGSGGDKSQLEIPKNHWKKAIGNDTCHHGSCQKYLNIKNGNVNCRKCGYLFCNEHTFYKMKINTDLQYDPENGVLVRCCKDCFMSKPGYKDSGYVRDLTMKFQQKRKEQTDERDLEVNRLERRLIKFYEYFLALELNGKVVVPYKKFETSVVNWENDAARNDCFICHNKFSISTMLRKHHCRLCGRIVCGDLATQCSLEVPMGVLMQYLLLNTEDMMKYLPLKENGKRSIRCCRCCKKTLFDRKLFLKDLMSPKPEILRIYETIVIYKTKIESMLPDFKKSLSQLNELDNTKLDTYNRTMDKFVSNHQTIQSISRDRIKLRDLFKKMDTMTKNLQHKLNKDEKEGVVSSDELRLEKSIYAVSVTFLQENMSRLQDLPSDNNNKQATNNIPSHAKITKKEIRINREKLMVLKEQKFLVEEMISNSKKKRKFDDLKSLEMNLKDLDKEINEIEQQLGDEFAFE